MAILRRPPSDRKLSERGTLYAFVNYDGGLPAHSKPEAKGRLLITDLQWELRFDGSKELVRGGLARYPLGVTATSATSCRVEIRDVQEPRVSTRFDMPDTPAEVVEQLLAGTMNGKVGAPEPGRGNTYRMADYDGGLSSNHLPTPAGSLVLTPRQEVELWFEGNPNIWKAPLMRYPLSVSATGPASSRVEIQDLKEPGVRGSFNLPETPAETLQADLSARPNGTWTQQGEDLQRNKVASKQSASFTVTYLGGLPEDPRKHQIVQTLQFNGGEGIGYGMFSLKKPLMTWKQVKSISVEGGQVAKSKVGPELAFGIFGALGAKGAKDRTYIIVNRNDGAQGVWEVDKMAPMQVRADLNPVLQVAGVPFVGEPLSAPPAPAVAQVAPQSMAEELERLAGLRDRGILSDEEFGIAKARLLEN